MESSSLSLLSTQLLDAGAQAVLRTTFDTAVPFPHLVIKDFLNKEKAKKLLHGLKQETFEEKDSDLFQFRQTENLAYSKNKTIKEFSEFVNSKEFSDVMTHITGIPLQVGTSDLFGSLYQDTDYLLCHDDQLENRKIAYILYLSEDFSAKDGGALALLSDDKGKPAETEQRYYPTFNTLVLFAVSSKSWHMVEEVLSARKKRYAVGGWLH